MTLGHRDIVEPLLARLKAPLSEYVFSNLYLFRAIHEYRLALEPIPHILGLTYDGMRHAMPLIPLDRSRLARLLECAPCVYPIPEQALAAVLDESLYVHWNDADSDYVYPRQQLAELGGPVLKSRKRQAASFEALAKPTVTALDESNVCGAYTLLDLWAQQVAPLNRQTDYAACREALDHFGSLQLSGMSVADSDGRTCAFLLASRQGSDTAVVHFAKADRSLEGVYPYLFSRFAAGTGGAWLNFEQDLGKPGLRRAKRALDPVRMLRKCRVSSRSGEVR